MKSPVSSLVVSSRVVKWTLTRLENLDVEATASETKLAAAGEATPDLNPSYQFLNGVNLLSQFPPVPNMSPVTFKVFIL